MRVIVCDFVCVYPVPIDSASYQADSPKTDHKSPLSTRGASVYAEGTHVTPDNLRLICNAL